MSSGRDKSSVGTKTLIRSLNDQTLDQVLNLRKDVTAFRGDVSDLRKDMDQVETRMEKRIEDRFDQHDKLMAERQARFDERDQAHDKEIGELRGENAALRKELSTFKDKLSEVDKKLAVAMAKGLGAGAGGGGVIAALVSYLMGG